MPQIHCLQLNILDLGRIYTLYGINLNINERAKGSLHRCGLPLLAFVEEVEFDLLLAYIYTTSELCVIPAFIAMMTFIVA